MGTGLDALSAPTSLTARRHAASSLPPFDLPPPPSNLHFPLHAAPRIPPLSTNIPQPAQSSNVQNLLTPPSNSASDVSSNSSHVAANTPNTQSGPSLQYTPTFWPGGTPTGYHTGFTPQPWQGGSLFPRASMFSPSLGSGRNNTHSPTAGEPQALPPPPYDLNTLAPFPSQIPSSSAHVPTSNTQHPSMSSILMHSSSKPSSQMNAPSHVESLQRSMYNQPVSTSSHPQTSYAYSGPSPVSHSAPTPDNSTHRVSPPTMNGAIPPIQHHDFIRPPYPSYSLPGMPGPVMANVNSPNGPLSVVGQLQGGMMPYHSGNIANPQSMYGASRSPHATQQVANDRPFRCDQCPQSFNRNHDLKRHKRIHLAVKPFPCGHCDKTFSRKDALKVPRNLPVPDTC